MKCPICGTYDVIGEASSNSPIAQNCCVNGHRFKTATCYQLEPPRDYGGKDEWPPITYDLDEWHPINY